MHSRTRLIFVLLLLEATVLGALAVGFEPIELERDLTVRFEPLDLDAALTTRFAPVDLGAVLTPRAVLYGGGLRIDILTGSPVRWGG